MMSSRSGISGNLCLPCISPFLFLIYRNDADVSECLGQQVNDLHSAKNRITRTRTPRKLIIQGIHGSEPVPVDRILNDASQGLRTSCGVSHHSHEKTCFWGHPCTPQPPAAPSFLYSTHGTSKQSRPFSASNPKKKETIDSLDAKWSQ